MMKNKKQLTRLKVSVALSAILSTAMLSGCAQNNTQQGVQAGSQPAIQQGALVQAPAFVDVASLFGGSDKNAVTLSPDGKWIAFLKMHNGAQNLFLVAADTPDATPIAITTLTDSVDSFIWSARKNEIIFSKDHHGNENRQLYKLSLNSQNPASSAMTRLTHNDKVDYKLLEQSQHDANTLVVAANHLVAARRDFFHLAMDTGHLERTQINDLNLSDAQLSSTGKVILGAGMNDDNSFSLYQFDGKAWQSVLRTQSGELLDIISFDEDSNMAYIAAAIEGRDKLELLRVNLTDKTVVTEHKDPLGESDLHHVVFDEQGQLLIASYYGGRLRNYAMTDEATKALAQIESYFTEDVEIKVEEVNKEGQWMVTVSYADRPDEKYTYAPAQNTLTGMLNDAPEFDPALLGDRKSITYTASDGVKIQAYLTLPKHIKKNLPTIVLPHGGPWARDHWGYSSDYFVPVAHYFANRGYAVLQPNFRGSLGFGKRFVQLAEKNWGTGTMQQDLTDGVNYLVEQGIADKQRIGIMGASYGGYAALAGATFTPDVYKAVISYVGPSSLITLMESFPAHYRPYLGTWYVSVGDPEVAQDRADMHSRSPINFVDQIKAPLMLVQGANDPRVTQSESDNIARALAAKNHPLEYLLAKDEGHGFRKPDNKLASIVAMEQFFTRHLGGSASQQVDPAIAAHLDTLRVNLDKL
ncbi:S9 family peptidase [Pseudoalteromonas rubra]|uniref:S9 family peptidase n=1 Tax=Pseudoalteromonas rubra TaxID=43658 RepID=UPI001F0C4623|nr:S9 family peptidase [Pseudoalteromonas rubra]